MISRSRRSILLRTSPKVLQHAPLLTVGLPHSAGLSVVVSSANAEPASKHHKRAEAGLTRMVVSFSQASTQIQSAVRTSALALSSHSRGTSRHFPKNPLSEVTHRSKLIARVTVVL